MASGRFNLDILIPFTLFDNIKINKEMNNHTEHHITPYKTLGIILIVLLVFTIITIEITSIDLAAWSVGVALLIACIKGYLVLSYFMHLKYESWLLRIMVIMVFLLFAVVIVITYIDYLNR